MPKAPRLRKTRAQRQDWPTSVRLPLDLKRDLQEEANKRQWFLTYVIIDILKQWQAFNRKQKEHADKNI